MPLRYLIAICAVAACCTATMIYFFTLAKEPRASVPIDADTPEEAATDDAAMPVLETASTTESGSTTIQAAQDEGSETPKSETTSPVASGLPGALATQTGTKPSTNNSVATTPKPVTPKPSAPSKPEVEEEDDEEEVSKPAASPVPPVVQNNGNTKWGVYVGYSGSELAAFEQLVGASADIRGVFVNWDDPFPNSFGSLKSSGKTLLIYWELYGGVTLDDIIAGKHDAYIKQFANGAQGYGGEIILAPMHEMNGNWDPWGGTVGNNTPEKVVSAWKHIHDTFGDVSNVKFGWAVNSLSVPDTPANALERYYPGDAYVDYVGVDGFNFGSPWETFDEVFADPLARLKKYGKPIYIFSVATAEGSLKDEWIYDFAAKVATHDLAGWVWFNEDKERDWRVNSDTDALAAFKAIVE